MVRLALLVSVLGIFCPVLDAQVEGRGTGTCSQLINGKYHQVPCRQPPSNPPPTSQQSPPGPSPEEIARAERLKKGSVSFQDGLRAMDLRDWNLAITKFSEALRLNPDNSEYKRKLESAQQALRDNETQQKLRNTRLRAENADAATKLSTFRDSLVQDSAKEKLSAFNRSLDAEPASNPSEYFYALQSRTLTPMNDGGRAIDVEEAMPEKPGMHGLVGGTTWTFGFKWPLKNCDELCRKRIDKDLRSHHWLFCTSQKDPAACYAEGLPFDPSLYDMVVSMGSAHTFLEDFATRVVWDQLTYGKFSTRHKEVFASLKGRSFGTLDCHSNGALLCLAALRSGETTAKEVRLFGPQVSPEAMKRWSELSKKTGMKITIYINEGDPVPALSWNLPAPRTAAGKAATLAWFTDARRLSAVMGKAMLESYLDSKHRIMDDRLKVYGVTVIRNRELDVSKCGKIPSIDCHSMRVYESRIVP